jgi:hypothetical protein
MPSGHERYGANAVDLPEVKVDFVSGFGVSFGTGPTGRHVVFFPIEVALFARAAWW